MTFNQIATKVKTILDSFKVGCFLVADTARLVSEDALEGAATLTLGVKAEDFIPKAKEIKDALYEAFSDMGGLPNEVLTQDGKHVRALKINLESFMVVIASYFTDGNWRFCPFSVNRSALMFKEELLDDMKKKKIGNKWFYVPSPIEDYLEATFKADGSLRRQVTQIPANFVELAEEAPVDDDVPAEGYDGPYLDAGPQDDEPDEEPPVTPQADKSTISM